MNDHNENQSTDTVESNKKRTIVKYSLIALFMFGFGFALSPMYTLFCSITGLNGRTVNAENEQVNVKVDLSREIKVRFITTTHTDLPWEFEANETWMTVHPGEINKATFKVTNKGKKAITGQAVPSLAPTVAASHFIKTDVFVLIPKPCKQEKSLKCRFNFILNLTFQIMLGKFF